MPLVVVGYNPVAVDKTLVGILRKVLPGVVAKKLTCRDHDGQLAAEDIEVWFQEVQPFDVYQHDLMVIIWANEYPDRRRNLDERREGIGRYVREVVQREGMDDIRGYVRVLLQPASFGEF